MKKPILGPCDSYQLAPFAYEWAWNMSKDCEANTWSPEEIGVANDVADYRSNETDPKHTHLFLSVMAQLTTFDIERGDDVAETFINIVQPAELKHFLKRLCWEECVVEGTEVLTQKGWSRVENISMTDKIIQWTPDNTLSWVTPMHISKTVRESSVLIETTDALHQHVTDGHRVPYWSDIGKLKVKTASKLTPNGHAKHPLCGTLMGGDKVTLSAVEQFLIALQADGSLSDRYTGERCGTIPAWFTLTKPRKRNRLEKIVKECGWEHTISPPDSRGRTNYIVKVPVEIQATKMFSDWVDLKSISAEWAKAFIEELSYWDAHRVSGYPRIEYFCTVKSNSDMVSAVASLAGYSVKNVLVVDNRKDTYSDVHWVYINKTRNCCKGSVLHISRSNQPATFYGIEVPSSFLLIRFNGRVSVTGNCLHTRSYRYIIENMGIPESGPDNIYDVWKGVPAMRNRIEMAQNISDELLELYYKSIGSGTPLGENIPFQRAFLRAAVFWFLIFEGVWFWVNLLGPVQQLSRLGVYTGAAEQFTYIARDEGQHIVYGVKLINEFLRQYPDCLNHDMINTIQEDAKQAIVLEGKFINYCLKDGSILGYSAIDHVETAKYFVNMRLKSIGLQEVFLGATHRFPWMSEQMEMQKEKNFFEKRVTEYRTGGSLSFDSEEDIQNSEEDQFRSVM